MDLKRFIPGRNTLVLLAIFFAYLTGVLILSHYFPVKNFLLSIKHFGIWAPVLFVALYLLRGFAYFPSLIFLIAASFLFSVWTGVITYLIGVLLSALLSYAIGRWFHEKPFFPGIKKRLSNPTARARIEKQGAIGVFFLHLIGFLDASNYVSGWLKVPVGRFLLAVFFANGITTGLYYGAYETFPFLNQLIKG